MNLQKIFNKNNNVLFVVLIILSLVAFLFFLENQKLNKIYEKELTQFIEKQKSFSEIGIEAKAVSVFDFTNHLEIYNKNENQILPLASLAKTMTAIVALKENPEDSIIAISALALKEEGGYGFSLNEKFKLKELVELTLIGSNNDGAYALIQNVPNYLNKMNQKAKTFSMLHTTFLNSTGLDLNSEKISNTGTAQEANLLAFYLHLMYPEISQKTTLPEIKIISNMQKIYTVQNTNTMVNKIPNPLFSKTGYTQLAGGNLTVLFKNKQGNKIAITVLGSTKEGRFTDMEKLINLAYDIDYGYNNR